MKVSIPSPFLRITILSVGLWESRMFAFDDPAVAASVQGECVFALAIILMRKKHNDHSFDRDPSEVLAHTIWYLPASIQSFPICTVTQLSITAGSFSQHSTTNGGSFGAITPTDGQYGSVVISDLTYFSRTGVLN